jgi:hypothetical protein
MSQTGTESIQIPANVEKRVGIFFSIASLNKPLSMKHRVMKRT